MLLFHRVLYYRVLESKYNPEVKHDNFKIAGSDLLMLGLKVMSVHFSFYGTM